MIIYNGIALPACAKRTYTHTNTCWPIYCYLKREKEEEEVEKKNQLVINMPISFLLLLLYDGSTEPTIANSVLVITSLHTHQIKSQFPQKPNFWCWHYFYRFKCFFFHFLQWMNLHFFFVSLQVERRSLEWRDFFLGDENVSMKLQNGHCNTSKYLFSLSRSFPMELSFTTVKSSVKNELLTTETNANLIKAASQW